MLHQLNNLILIFLGGGLGSVFRYGVKTVLEPLFLLGFPSGTFIVNITGSFIMGMILGFGNFNSHLSGSWSSFLIVGFLGGYTTFSGFSAEAVSLFQKGEVLSGCFYVFLSVFVSITAVLAGLLIFRFLK